MISLEDLKSRSRIKNLSLGNTEKDYLIDLVMFSISKNTGSELVFKGGTCLCKFYGLGRFSEDVDFTAAKPVDTDRLMGNILSVLRQFGINCRIQGSKKPFSSVLTKLRCEGPLFNGKPQTYSNVRIDINLKSSIDTEPSLRNYSSLYPDVPKFSLLVMQEKEILAEKVRAIMTRSKARDIYDLWFLLKSGVEFDPDLVRKKLSYYREEWDAKEFLERLAAKKNVWMIELGPLIADVPDFEDAMEHISRKVPA